MAKLTSTKSFVQIGDPLNRNQFGKLVRVKSLSDGAEFTVKQLELKKVYSFGKTDEEIAIKETLLSEANQLVSVGHPNLMRVLATFEEEGLLNIVMDDCKSGTLANAIHTRAKKCKPFSEYEILYISFQILQALNYLNAVKEICHRDVKAENIYLLEGGKLAKLGNFGIVRWFHEMNEQTDLLGTATHLAPEVINKEPYTYKSEMWAMGVTIYHMAALKLPFQLVGTNTDSLFKTILETYPETLPNTYSSDFHDYVMNKMLAKNSNKRCSATIALSLPIFFKFVKKSSSNAKQENLDVEHPEPELTEALFQQLFTSARRGNVADLKDHVDKFGVESILAIRDSNGDRLIHSSALYGQVSTVTFLLDKGADIEEPGYVGRTPLLTAAAKGHSKVIDVLLKRKAKIDAKSYGTDDNSTAAHLAASFGHIEALKTLIKANKKVLEYLDKDGDMPLHRCAMKGHSDTCEALVKSGAPLEAKGGLDRTPFLVAIEKGHLPTVVKLVELGANIHAVSSLEDCEGTAIHLATEFQKLEICNYLLNIHPDFLTTKDSNNNQPINNAALCGHIDILNFFIKKGASVETKGFNGRTPLLNACSSGAAEMVKHLLDRKVDAGASSGAGDTEARAIHLAAAFGHPRTITVLLEHFPSMVAMQNGKDDLPMHVAAAYGQIKSLEALLKMGADIEGRGFQGRTPLMAAGCTGQVEAVEFLINKGAKMSALTDDNYGDSVIHLAAYFGRTEVVAYLARIKATLLSLRNKGGETALQRASINKQQAVIDFIKSKVNSIEL